MSSKNQSSAAAPTSERVTNLAHDAIDSASEKAADVETKLREEAGRLAEKSNERAREAREKLDETVNTVDSFVREKPFAAAGIAFAAGVLGAMWLKRS